MILSKILLLNKRADEKYLSIWMFINWFVVGLAVVIGVILVSSIIVDSRQLEANLLSEKLVSCLSNNFKFSEVSTENFDILSKCSIDKKIILNGNYVVYLKLYGIVEGIVSSKEVFSKSIGDSGFLEYCKLQDEKKAKGDNLPQCSFSQLELFDAYENKLYSLEVTVASNQK